MTSLDSREMYGRPIFSLRLSQNSEATVFFSPSLENM